MKSANRPSEIDQTSEIDFSGDIQKLTSARAALHPVEEAEGETAGHSVGTLMDRLSEAPRREIEGTRRDTYGVAQKAADRRRPHST